MRRAWLIAGFAASAAVLVAALVWILVLARRLEASEAEARRHAAREERVRLALWRMDSALAAFLAFENAAPVDPPDGLRAADPPWIGRRFELDGASRAVATAPAAEPAAGAALDAGRLLALLGQPALGVASEVAPGGSIAGAGTGTDAGRGREPAPPAAATTAVPAAAIPADLGPAAAPPAPRPAALAAATDPAPGAEPGEPGAPRSKTPIVRDEELTQSRANIAEYLQRQKVAGQQSSFVPAPISGPEPPAAGGVSGPGPGVAAAEPAAAAADSRPPAGGTVPSAPGAGNAPGAEAAGADRHAAGAADAPGSTAAGVDPRPAGAGEPPETTAAAVDPRTPDGGESPATAAAGPPVAGPAAVAAPPAASPPRGARRGRPRGPTGVVRALEPAWVDGRLLLVRRVVRDGAESLQGIALDEAALSAWLLGEVRDLLPAGDLEPVPAGEASDPGRRLALLPWRLEPGPVPEIEAGGRPSVRLGLTLAAGAIVVVAATAGLLLLAGLRLARRRTEFASAVIHELRTPLTTFRVYTDLLAEGMVEEQERPGYFATLRSEADRLGHLVENVLGFARLERRRPPAAPPIALGPALRAAAERLARRAAEAGLELDVKVAPAADAAEVAIDPVALERIVDNLCDNSCRYGRGGAAAPLELSAALRGRHAVVRWRDHGPGVARAERRRLFRPFQRSGAAGDPTAPAAGVGLGLALSRQLARRSGGDLRFTEPPGGGAAFELWLPVASRAG